MSPERPDLTYKVGFLGAPNTFVPVLHAPVEWNNANIGRLKALGFNTIQLNVAWGGRPGGEPLNIEEVVELTREQRARYPQPVPLRCDLSPEACEWRRRMLRERLALCQKAGMRTIFHFGAPYNAHCTYGDNPPNCISDPKVAERYALLIAAFARDFPGVDDLLIYTWDQDAWLCNEFGECLACRGVPLHERILPFLSRLAAEWRKHSPRGILWWEPWEFSSGQALNAVERLDTTGIGLAMHANIAEVMATVVGDRWLRNMCQLAKRRGIPAIVEYFLGGPTEEVETYVNFSHPLVTLRGLRTIASIPGVVGIKEYYGLVPDKEDPNLRMTGLFFEDPSISDDDALSRLAEPYGPAASEMVEFWTATSEGIEIYPWDTAWIYRHISNSATPAHPLTLATINGYLAHTPSWASTRQAIYMKTDNLPPDPWMREDVELRCRLAADRWARAIRMGGEVLPKLSGELARQLEANLADLGGIRRRALGIAYHMRESNLVVILRKAAAEGGPAPERVVSELIATLERDAANIRDEGMDAESLKQAALLLRENTTGFLATYFREASA